MAEPNEPPHSAGPPEDFLLRHLPLIQRIVAHYGWRWGLKAQDVEEFGSWVNEKLIEDDYRKIRAYRGLCSPDYFLSTTIGRLGKDFLDRIWQRWRPSADARKQGPVAVILQRLLYRDHRTFDEAYEELRTRHGVTASREELEKLALKLPHGQSRRTVSDECLEDTAGKGPSPEQAAIQRQESYRLAEILKFLKQATTKLPARDRLLLRLNLAEGLSIADIARVQKADQKALYRQREKILRLLREELSGLGVKKDEIDPLFGGGSAASP